MCSEQHSCPLAAVHLVVYFSATSLSAGLRPFGVSILYMGWDPHFGFQLYQSDPSGNYGGWKATCIGNNYQVSKPVCIVYPVWVVCSH